jgi:hypothetical protein
MKTENKTEKKIISQFSTYFVYRYLPLNGTEYQAGDTINLTAKQARFHIINGFIGKTKKSFKKVQEPQIKKSS